MRIARLAGWTAAIITAGLVTVQFVPYGRHFANPPVVAEPDWDSPETRALAARACFDCHSNETKWPAYARIAPVSWLVAHDVEEGREALNFSEWHRTQKEAREAGEETTEGDMPLGIYTIMHPPARLTEAERAALANGLTATVRRSPAGSVVPMRSGD